MNEKYKNTTKKNEHLSRKEEPNESEDMGKLSSDEESDLYSITKGTCCPT